MYFYFYFKICNYLNLLFKTTVCDLGRAEISGPPEVMGDAGLNCCV